MAVAKRQGREKPAKMEQKKVKGRSKDQSEGFRQNKQRSCDRRGDSPAWSGRGSRPSRLTSG